MMWWLYLDESGDLGFDFVNRKPSNFFTICILATSSPETNRRFRYTIKKTMKRKVNHGRKHPLNEFKAHQSSRNAKEYACNLLQNSVYGIFALTLNKRRVYRYLADDKARVYNYVARLLIDHIPFESATGNVLLTIDQSKGSAQRREFNEYISAQLEGRLDPKVELDLRHENSVKSAALQMVDMFAWSIHRKYEQRDDTYMNLFAAKVRYDEQYL